MANRKHFADMLDDGYAGLRQKAKRRLREKAEVLRESLIKEHAEKNGASAVLKQLDEADRKRTELIVELKQLGFERADHGLELFDRDTNPLDAVIEKRIEKELGSERDIDARFDSAQLAMLTVSTLQDAHQLLKSVQDV